MKLVIDNDFDTKLLLFFFSFTGYSIIGLDLRF